MNTPPNNTAFESAPDKRDYTPGRLLKRVNTVRASVLASLLQGDALTGLESVFKESTTRLGAAIFALDETHGWTIERRDVVVGTSDGRIATITTYWLPQSTIKQAFEAGAGEWISNVKAARAERRKLAGQCKRNAAQINARRFDPRQSDMWGQA